MVTSRKMYAVKRSKTGRKNVVQVLNKQGKSNVYASTGKKLSASTKTFTTKSAAQKHLHNLQKKKSVKSSSSFGRKKRSSQKFGAAGTKGHVVVETPESDWSYFETGNPDKRYKRYTATKYKVNGDHVAIFSIGTKYDKKYYKVTSSMGTLKDCFTTSSTKAAELVRKKNEFAGAGVDDDYTVEQCQATTAGDAKKEVFGGSILGLSNGNRIRFSGLGPEFLDPRRREMRMQRGELSNEQKSKLVQYFNRTNQSHLASIFGTNAAAYLSGNKITVGGRSIAIPDGVTFNPRTGDIEVQQVNERTMGGQRRPSMTSAIENQGNNLPFGRYNNFGSRMRGNIPTFGRYAYPMDPALGGSSFGNRSRFGLGSSGYRPSSFGRINYGFSRYF